MIATAWAWLTTKISRWVAYAGLIAVAVLGAFLTGYLKGKAVQKRKRLQNRLDGMKQRKESDEEIDSLGPADLDRRWHDIMRDGDR